MMVFFKFILPIFILIFSILLFSSHGQDLVNNLPVNLDNVPKEALDNVPKQEVVQLISQGGNELQKNLPPEVQQQVVSIGSTPPQDLGFDNFKQLPPEVQQQVISVGSHEAFDPENLHKLPQQAQDDVFQWASSRGINDFSDLPKLAQGQLEDMLPWLKKKVVNGTGLPTETLVLAANRTNRKDPLNGLKRYTGGWNISNKHYWSSVGFTAGPLFGIAAAWFLLFGLTLMLLCCCSCCCRKEHYGYSQAAYVISLILLVLFTLAVFIGCGVLYTGNEKFHEETAETLLYLVSKAQYTFDNLGNVTSYLAAAKNVQVRNVFLPAEIQTQIDQVVTMVSQNLNTISTRVDENTHKILRFLDKIRVSLIVLSAIMLFLAVVGFLLSLCGLQSIVSLLVVIGWILVTATFILSGICFFLHNVVGDTCVAMDEWVQHPAAHTALDDLLPCVDGATANETWVRSKQVTNTLADVVNQVITNISNINFSPNFPVVYYNQSGPLVPVLCSPYNADTTDRQCGSDEVDISNATEVWKPYVCQVSGAGICTTVGRLNPDMYQQMSMVVNVSYALIQYGPFLVDLLDCTFVRETFSDISEAHCPGLKKYSDWTYIGLSMVSSAVMLSLIFLIIYARERRHRVYTRKVDGHK